ncbi:hypothetical protein MM300_04920 [Evansella sp. LMS18]|uniref:hypothetical protein n=1 Tax=Evansella sp. LMS18 TaxID=2924033 RepID=UPI0020D0C7B7|nr:hypothetical protein [Evansella sp. LMS18]UTR11657.1 hypothetical protein MM300_04920 [Evansella sp. LMS18]
MDQQTTGMNEQPGMQPQQQNIMPEPPEVITSKDHLYISDMLSWNLLAMKKAHAFAAQCQDQQISQALDEAGRMHHMHYQMLLAHFDKQNQSQNSSQLQ